MRQENPKHRVERKEQGLGQDAAAWVVAEFSRAIMSGEG